MTQHRVIGLLAVTGLSLLLWTTAARAEDQVPDATIQFNGGSVAAGIGVSWGAGVLDYQGKSYAFKVSGLSIGDVGLSQASASGEVFNLKKLDDFNGNYAAVGTGVTVAGGGTVAAMKNQNGVAIQVKSTTQGAKVVIGGAGVSIEILK